MLSPVNKWQIPMINLLPFVKMIYAKMSAFRWLLADILLYTIFTTRLTINVALDIQYLVRSNIPQRYSTWFAWACEKVASDLGLGSGFRRVIRFPPLLTTG